MPSWAPNTDRVVDTQWGRSRQGAAVTGLAISYVVSSEWDEVAGIVYPQPVA